MLSEEKVHMQSRLEDLALLFFEYVSFPFEHIHLNKNFVNVNETLLLPLRTCYIISSCKSVNIYVSFTYFCFGYRDLTSFALVIHLQVYGHFLELYLVFHISLHVLLDLGCFFV